MGKTDILCRVCVVVDGLLFLALLVIGCAGSLGSLPTAEQLIGGGAVSEDVDPRALHRGRTIAVTECSSCHRFYWPHEYSPDEWARIVGQMQSRSSLSRSQTDDLAAYLQAASRAAREPAPVP